MKRLAIKIAVFLAPLLALLSFVECRLRQMPTSYGVKRRDADNHIATAEALITGSSREYYGINPAAMHGYRDGINLANAGQSLYYDVALVERYLQRAEKLRLVIIGLSHFSFALAYDADSSEAFRMYDYEDAYGIPPEKTQFFDARRWSLVSRYSPPQALRFALDGFRNATLSPLTEAGWYASSCATADSLSDDNAAWRVQFHTAIMHSENIKKNVQALKVLLTELRARAIRVVFAIMPVHGSYRKLVPMAKLDEFRGLYSEIARDEGADVFDHYADGRFVDADFADADHLCTVGAAKFADVLSSDLSH